MGIPTRSKKFELRSLRVRSRRIFWIAATIGVISFLVITIAPIALISVAKNAIRKGQVENALIQLDRAEHFLQYAGEIDFYRARCFRRLGRAKEFTTAIISAHNEGFPAEILDREQTYFLAQAGQLREIEQDLADIFEDAGEDSGEACEAYANGLLINLRQQEALNVVEHWAKDYPKDARPECVRGQIYKSINRNKLAEAAFRRALVLDADSSETEMMLGDLLLENRNLDDAAEVFKKLAKTKQFHDIAWLNISRIERMKGNLSASNQALKQVIKPDELISREFQLQVGLLAVDEQKFEFAEPILRGVLLQYPKDLEAQQGLAIALRGLGRQSEASERAAIVATIQDQRHRIGQLYDRVVAKPDDPIPRLEIGKIELQYGEITRGIIWLQSVLNLQPENSEAIHILAQYYQEQSQTKPEFSELSKYYRAKADKALHE
ncbi:MAG: tetratricopeptide repeat protein [Planctomycetaceae bacterium]